MIDREGGVENQSPNDITENGLETETGQPKRTTICVSSAKGGLILSKA